MQLHCFARVLLRYPRRTGKVTRQRWERKRKNIPIFLRVRFVIGHSTTGIALEIRFQEGVTPARRMKTLSPVEVAWFARFLIGEIFLESCAICKMECSFNFHHYKFRRNVQNIPFVEILIFAIWTCSLHDRSIIYRVILFVINSHLSFVVHSTLRSLLEWISATTGCFATEKKPNRMLFVW